MSNANKGGYGKLPDGAHGDFPPDAFSYSKHLVLEDLLGLQQRITDEHEEMMFIIIHQTSELWIRLMLHELRAMVAYVREDRLHKAHKAFGRIGSIQGMLTQSWTVLATMTPVDFLTFRGKLGHASGLQSYQYREMEFMLGNKREVFLTPFQHQPQVLERLRRVLAEPSLYDEAIRLLARRGFAIAPEVLDRNPATSYAAHESVEAAWLEIYRDTDRHWDLYQFAEKLVEFEDAFQHWRYCHLSTVTRIIGMKRGTGGTSGVDYLKRALDYCFFPELWTLRTKL